MQDRFWAKLISVVSVASGATGLVLLAVFPLGSLSIVQMELSDLGIIWWDGLLSLAFFLQHSGMVRRQFRVRLYHRVAGHYHRALYSIASGVMLVGVALLWQPSSDHLLVLGRPFRWLAFVLAASAVTLFVWGALSVRNLDLFGTRAIRAYARGLEEQPPTLLIVGPYRWVRHPWYLAAIMLFWSCTDFTADRLLFNILWTAWICVATTFEERDLVRDFGSPYRQYQRQVPMLVPCRRPAAM